jgi:hypothetical protein
MTAALLTIAAVTALLTLVLVVLASIDLGSRLGRRR